MKFFLVLLVSLTAYVTSCAQVKNDIIDVKEVERIENVLAADDMQGRKAFTPAIDKAANFIADEFKKAGLKTFKNAPSFLQSFAMVRPKFLSVKGELDDKEIDPKNVIVITTNPDLKVNEKSGYEIIRIAAGKNIRREAAALMNANKNVVAFVDTSYSNDFPRLTNLKRQIFGTDKSVVLILSNESPKEFNVKAEHEISEQKLANVVGVLPGKTRPNEFVIFSAHYDHVGIGKPVDGDSIYNGANDDAAGTTAVIMLAKHYSKLNNNDRTLVFAAFTAEEVGGYGSQYFSKQFDPASIVAMMNIEMIGTESKWGRNSAFITGFEKSDFGTILQKNLAGSDFKFEPDPYPTQQLFYRSDNATLARLGVPAHTVSTAKMENEPHYHKPSDEVKTLDLTNMAAIIRAIALSATSIISGKDTPSRVKVEELR